MIMRPSISTRTILVAVFLSSLIACAPATEEKKENDHSTPQAPIEVDRDDQVITNLKLLTQYAYVPLKEFTCITSDVWEHFKVGPASAPTHMGRVPYQFTVNSLTDALPICAAHNEIGVVIYHGLDTSNKYVPAFQFVCLNTTAVPDSFTFAPVDDYYLISGNALVKQAGQKINAWQPAIDLRTKVVVQRYSDGPYFPFKKDTDVEYVVFPYKAELDLLLQHNNMQGTDLISVAPTSTPLQWTVNAQNVEYTFDHEMGICWVPNVTLTDVVDPQKSFQAKAANLGSPCPPLCKGTVKFREQGEPTLPSCK